MVQLTTEQGIFITNKNKVFSTPSQDVDMLRKRIRDTFDELRQQPDILCVERNGGHVEGHAWPLISLTVAETVK